MIFVITALLGGFVEIVKKPALLLPSAIAAGLLLLILFFSQTTVQGFLFDLVLNENIPQASFSQLPWLFYSMYANEINLLLALAFVFGIASNWLAFCFARFVKEREGVLEAIGFATANLPKAFLLAIFTGLVLGFFFALFWIIAVAAEAIAALGIIVGMIAAILALLAFLVLLFLPTAAAIEDASIKVALKKSAELVRKKAISAIVFVLIVGLVYALISNLGTNLANEASDDTIATLIEFVFLLIATSYSGIAVPLYYLSAQK